jgi:NOL1/NOP2/fmu family ribosome biogenesis protein
MSHSNPIIQMPSKLVNTMNEFLLAQYGATFPQESFLLHSKENKIFMLTAQAESVRPKLQRINSQGLYVGEFNEAFTQIRLSIEGSQLIGKNATQNIYDLDSNELEQWAKGESINPTKDVPEGYFLIRYKTDFYSVGRFKNGEIMNFVPKVRRLRTLNK